MTIWIKDLKAKVVRATKGRECTKIHQVPTCAFGDINVAYYIFMQQNPSALGEIPLSSFQKPGLWIENRICEQRMGKQWVKALGLKAFYARSKNYCSKIHALTHLDTLEGR